MLKKLLKKKDKKKEIEDILLVPKPDRRLLANVPDEEGERSNTDRRGAAAVNLTSTQNANNMLTPNDVLKIRQTRYLEQHDDTAGGKSLAPGHGHTPQN